jgi:outer membrane lipopolysaccharide assembly protein LptE/RlpB
MKFLEKIFFLYFFIILFLLSSCGYSLRENSSELSKQDLVVISDNSDLNLELISQLKAKDNMVLRIKNIENDNGLIIKIKFHELNKFSGAVGAGARTTQARLDYAISYELSNKKKIIIENIFKSTKYLSFNQSDLLSMEREENILVKNFINDGIKNMEFLLALKNNED